MSWTWLLPAILLGLATPDAATPDAATPDGVTDEGGAERLLETVDALAHEVSALRKIPLSPKEHLPASIVGRREARAHLERMLRHQLPAGELELQSRILQALGLLPRSADYLGLMLDAAVQEMAGFYDPTEHRLFVADWVAPAAQRPIVAHEIAHALQDRKFGLEKLLGLTGTRTLDSDAQLALQALAEGDATIVMMELLDPNGGFAGGRSLAGTLRRIDGEPPPAASDRRTEVPRYLRETMMFPYLDGVQFVARVRSRRPWSAVDALWHRPPESTEQILHPEKYECHEPSLRIQAAPLVLAPGQRELGADTMGELQLRVWLSGASSRSVAERAAAGWGGDRVVAHDIGGSTVLAWLTAWDSEADAADFAAAAAESLTVLAHAPRAGLLPSAGAALTMTGRDGKLHGLLLQGTRVALLIGAPTSAEHALREMMGWKSSPAHAPGACSGEEPATGVRKPASSSPPASAPRPARSPGARR